MDGDDTGIQTDRPIPLPKRADGIQVEKPVPPWERPGDFRLDPERHRRKSWWRLGCSLAVLFFLAIAGLFWWDDAGPVRRAEGMVAEDGPEVGATREEVEAWLDRRGIQHSRQTSMKERGGYPATQSPCEFDGLAPGIQGAYVIGTMPAWHFYGWAGAVWIYFFFDSDGRLIQHVVKRWDGYL